MNIITHRIPKFQVVKENLKGRYFIMEKSIIRIYKTEEMEAMNYILGKDKDNKTFTKFELEAMNKIDLFNKKVVEVCKVIWANEMLGGAN
jgi:hypothetical protein